MDWGKGEYERTARELEPAASAAIDALHPHHGERILDVACGTGNAAILAARQGAEVIGVDGSERLIEVAAQRGRMEAVGGEWRVGDIEDLPFEDDHFDGVISVFGVIFAEDPERAAAELKRVAKPGGRIVLTAWLASGPIGDVMKVVSETVREYAPGDTETVAHLNWSDQAALRELFGPDTEVTNHQIAFHGRSPGAWILEQSEFHPAWMEVRNLIPADRHEQLLDELTAIATAANSKPGALELVSDYVIVRARV